MPLGRVSFHAVKKAGLDVKMCEIGLSSLKFWRIGRQETVLHLSTN